MTMTRTVTMEEEFLEDVLAEVGRARKKFPHPDGLMAALTEETGEVAKAFMDEPVARIREECVQVAAMALRCAIDGDPSFDRVRERRMLGHQTIRVPLEYEEPAVFRRPASLDAANVLIAVGKLLPILLEGMPQGAAKNAICEDWNIKSAIAAGKRG